MRALVIDDARVMRMLLRGAMEKLGFEVSEASDGEEGLSRLRQAAPPDVVLVDCFMPKMDGLQFVRQVRKIVMSMGVRVMISWLLISAPQHHSRYDLFFLPCEYH